MTDLVKENFFEHLTDLNLWFGEAKEALGLNTGADRGRVLASLKKLVTERDAHESEKRLVVQALGYKRWGDLLTMAQSQLGPVVEVVLPEVFNVPPNGWLFGKGGLDYTKAQKRLVQTQLRVKEVWAYVDERLDEEGLEWADKARADLIDLFVESTDPADFDYVCLAFVRNYHEPDPNTTWVKVASVAASEFEKGYHNHPIIVVESLLSYAEEAGVEQTQATVNLSKEALNPLGYWFPILLSAYLYKTDRPEDKQIIDANDLFFEVIDYLRYFEKDPTRRTRYYEEVYYQSLTLAQLEEAIKRLVEFQQSYPNGTHNDLAKAVIAAVAAV